MGFFKQSLASVREKCTMVIGVCTGIIALPVAPAMKPVPAKLQDGFLFTFPLNQNLDWIS